MAIQRRRFLGAAGLVSLFSLGPMRRFSLGNHRPRDLYRALGVRPVVNFRGTHTVIGASKCWPDLHEAMGQAARDYVFLEELQDKIGERLARLIGCEEAMVTTGAAGAMTLGTCACLTGGDVEKVRRLPDLTGMKTEVLIQKVHRNAYDHAIRNAGVRLVEVESRAELEQAANERTAMMYFLGGTSGDYAWQTPISLESCLTVSKAGGFPLLVDAANMLPPWDNLRKLVSLGVDLIAISGGKHMRGPQCSGILAGRKDLVRAARLNTNPHSDSLGRPMKVGREEMIGVWLAAEKYARLDFAALERQSQNQAEYLARELKKIPALDVSFAPHDRTRRVYRVVVRWDEAALRFSATDCEKELLDGNPRIAVLRDKLPGLMFTVFMNEPGDERAAARRLREIFARRVEPV